MRLPAAMLVIAALTLVALASCRGPVDSTNAPPIQNAAAAPTDVADDEPVEVEVQDATIEGPDTAKAKNAATAVPALGDQKPSKTKAAERAEAAKTRARSWREYWRERMRRRTEREQNAGQE